jgi:hypothetical protein
MDETGQLTPIIHLNQESLKKEMQAHSLFVLIPERSVL